MLQVLKPRTQRNYEVVSGNLGDSGFALSRAALPAPVGIQGWRAGFAMPGSVASGVMAEDCIVIGHPRFVHGTSGLQVIEALGILPRTGCSRRLTSPLTDVSHVLILAKREDGGMG